jgi:hypothetical protein
MQLLPHVLPASINFFHELGKVSLKFTTIQIETAAQNEADMRESAFEWPGKW